jgi:hypothetical protein
VGAHVSVCACCANGHATRGRVLVCGRTASVARWASTLEHAFVGFSSPIAFTCVSCSPCSSTCMHKNGRFCPIAGLARGWMQTTRIVRCVILAPMNLRRSRNLPRRRLFSRAERRQKPKSAPDDAPVRWRWPVPGTSDTIIVHSLASFQRWKRPGDELGGAARGGSGLGLVVTNLGEWRRLARSRAGGCMP